ncbi:hypothetical protein BDC45DRAFT_533314 [Circinella umbellata]|nr:hypothetical protein BDC45DRAFT_533314 [Circinella umbellata]
MSDLNWCTYCDNAVNSYSDSLYCSESCLKSDALRNHPLLGYDWHEFEDFPRPHPSPASSVPISSQSHTLSSNKSASFSIHAPPSSNPSPALTVTTTSSSSSSTASSSLRSVSLAMTPPSTKNHSNQIKNFNIIIPFTSSLEQT